VLKPCFCGPCFGAGDVPVCSGLSARHTTRNFPNREGSRPADGQSAGVILMDARSIAATARMGGVLTSAMEIDYTPPAEYERRFDPAPYEKRVYQGFGKADQEAELRFGPNIVPWPEIPDCGEHLLVKLCSVLEDEVTTTDELIPSGETSSYRSNPLKLAQFALSRRDPGYVGRSKEAQAEEAKRAAGDLPQSLRDVMAVLGLPEEALAKTRYGSAIFARKPGDGSAREQAASCQRILGGCANLCYEFATKRYRSNCVNWGILPFILNKENEIRWQVGDYLFVPDLKKALLQMEKTLRAQRISDGKVTELELSLEGLNEEERDILLAGCLMNWYKQGKGTKA
jgi:aconitate hydratase